MISSSASRRTGRGRLSNEREGRSVVEIIVLNLDLDLDLGLDLGLDVDRVVDLDIDLDLDHVIG